MRRAFTLVELLTVIAIIGILAALCFPSYRRVREQAKAASCTSNLHQVGLAIMIYANENNQYPELYDRMDKLEQLPSLDTAIFKSGGPVLHCPSDQTYFDKTGTSYAWNILLSGLPIGSDCLIGGTDLSRIPLASEKHALHFVSVMADGHVSKDFVFQKISVNNGEN